MLEVRLGAIGAGSCPSTLYKIVAGEGFCWYDIGGEDGAIVLHDFGVGGAVQQLVGGSTGSAVQAVQLGSRYGFCNADFFQSAFLIAFEAGGYAENNVFQSLNVICGNASCHDEFLDWAIVLQKTGVTTVYRDKRVTYENLIDR